MLKWPLLIGRPKQYDAEGGIFKASSPNIISLYLVSSELGLLPSSDVLCEGSSSASELSDQFEGHQYFDIKKMFCEM